MALALPAAMLAGPFSHVHEPGKAGEHVAEHHEGGLDLHLHVAGVRHGERTWTPEADASAQALNLYRVDLTDAYVLSVVIVSELVAPEVELLTLGWARDSDPRIHDPPRIRSRSPRAPPV